VDCWVDDDFVVSVDTGSSSSMIEGSVTTEAGSPWVSAMFHWSIFSIMVSKLSTVTCRGSVYWILRESSIYP